MSNNTESNAVVKQESAPAALSSLPLSRNGIQLQTIDDVFRFAKAVVAAGLAPKGFEKPESVFIALQMGLEVGISPMAALQNVAVIHGKPKFYGSMPLALVRASGLLESIKEFIEGTGDNRKAVCITKRRGDADSKTTTFSVQDAKQAGLWGKNVHATYPERMLMYRARGFNLDDNFSDVLKGMASHEAVIELEPEAVTVSKSKRIAEPEPEPEPELKQGFRAEKSYQRIVESFRLDGWEKAIVHFGTAEKPFKGMQLGELKVDHLDWLSSLLQWEPEAVNEKYHIDDLVLRAALDVCEEKLAAHTATKVKI